MDVPGPHRSWRWRCFRSAERFRCISCAWAKSNSPSLICRPIWSHIHALCWARKWKFIRSGVHVTLILFTFAQLIPQRRHHQSLQRVLGPQIRRREIRQPASSTPVILRTYVSEIDIMSIQHVNYSAGRFPIDILAPRADITDSFLPVLQI